MNLSKAFFITIFFLAFTSAHAQTVVDDLKAKISEKSASIEQLEQEIRSYQTQIEGLGKEANSLKNTLAGLDLSKKKLEADLQVTQKKIDNTNLEIMQLSNQINDKSERIGDSRRVIAQSLSAIARNDSQTLLEDLLGASTLAQAWHTAEELSSLQSKVTSRIHELQSMKVSLEDNKKKTEQKKAQLVSLQNDLSNQKKALAETVKEKNELLGATKNSEAAYKQLLVTRQAQKVAFEKELFEYESALKVAIDPSSLPSAGKGILSWPLKSVKITQQFGQTRDSARLYVSGSHGGVDFAASVGTPVYAALGGVVSEVEGFNIRQGCQYGKFVLIKHANGLSTIYGHLSGVSVEVGDKVATGERIGSSGNTGYSTGPHLHFGVYATQGVRVVDARDLGSKSCAGIKTVAASPNAYLDPLLYL